MRRALILGPALVALVAACSGRAASADPGPAGPTAEELATRFRSVSGRHDDLSYEVQRNAADLLAAMGTPPARKALHALWTETSREPDPRRANVVLGALVASGGPEDVDLAIRHAEADRGTAAMSTLFRVLARATSPDARAHLRDALSDATRPVKAQIARALGVMEDPDAVMPLLAALRDDDPSLRAEVLAALGALRDDTALPAMAVFLRGEDARVRDAAARALAAMRTKRATPYLVRSLADPSPLVVESAASALAVLDERSAVEPLIERLATARGDLRLVEAITAALERLTGMAIGDDADLWRAWWAQAKDHPIDPSAREKPTTVSGPRYYGFRVRSSRVAFVLDVSRSMGWNGRLDAAKAELQQVIEHLPASSRFNLVTFSDVADTWSAALVPATPGNVQKAVRYVARQEPQSGTNVHDAMRAAFQDESVDTIYLLSDGSPSVGAVVEPEELLSTVREANRWRRVRVFTIALLKGEAPPAFASMEDPVAAASFMRRLAAENGGEFREVR